MIATRSTAAVGDVLDEGRLGRLVAPGDADAFAAAVTAELDERTHLHADTRQWVERYTIDAGVQSHVEALGLTEPARRTT